jgi:hypothetical protein
MQVFRIQDPEGLGKLLRYPPSKLFLGKESVEHYRFRAQPIQQGIKTGMVEPNGQPFYPHFFQGHAMLGRLGGGGKTYRIPIFEKKTYQLQHSPSGGGRVGFWPDHPDNQYFFHCLEGNIGYILAANFWEMRSLSLRS